MAARPSLRVATPSLGVARPNLTVVSFPVTKSETHNPFPVTTSETHHSFPVTTSELTFLFRLPLFKHTLSFEFVKKLEFLLILIVLKGKKHATETSEHSSFTY
jgi:hypothetical protein